MLSPALTDEPEERPSEILVVIVPSSLVLNSKLGVESLSGELTAVTIVKAGATLSIEVFVQLNVAAAEFEAEEVAPVYAPAATSMVVAPAEVGVNVAVYVIPVVEDLIPLKLDMVPLETCISEASKLVVTSLEVNTSVIEESPEELPSVTPEVELVIVIEGLLLGWADKNSILSI